MIRPPSGAFIGHVMREGGHAGERKTCRPAQEERAQDPLGEVVALEGYVIRTDGVNVIRTDRRGQKSLDRSTSWLRFRRGGKLQRRSAALGAWVVFLNRRC
jgi:hypothetical protein